MKPLHKTYRFGREFMTDGCTGVTFENEDGTHNECAYNQCIEHDYFYQHGGITRKEADKRLYNGLLKCVSKFEAWIAYKMVRLFGWRYWSG